MGINLYTTDGSQFLPDNYAQYIDNESLPDYDKFFARLSGLDWIGLNRYFNTEVAWTDNGDAWLLNFTSYYGNIANYVKMRMNQYGFSNVPFIITELNLDGSSFSIFDYSNKAKPAYASFLNQISRNSNITGETWFTGPQNFGSNSQYYGMWNQNDNIPENSSSGVWDMKKSWVKLNVNNSQITSCSSSDTDFECLSVIKPSGAKGLTLINKAYAITDTNVTLDTSSGLLWDFQANNYISDINQTLSKYNVTFVGLNSGNFNLTEGKSTGLLDTNGFEITDDVNNVSWIASNKSNTRFTIGNNLSNSVNITFKGTISNCALDRILTSNKDYEPQDYACNVNNSLTLNLSNVPVGEKFEINITYHVSSGNNPPAVTGVVSGGPSSPSPTGNETQNIEPMTGSVTDTSVNENPIKVKDTNFWVIFGILAFGSIIVATIYGKWQAAMTVFILGIVIILVVGVYNGMISLG